LATGDGKTPQTAYVTISIPEERAILNFLRLTMVSQALVNDHYRDRFETVSQEGIKQVIYFFPEAHYARLAKKLNVQNPVARPSSD